MAFIDYLKNLFDRDRDQLIAHRFEPDQVDPRPQALSATADVHYFRIKLVEMFLSKQVAWFQSLYPAVHSLVRCNFGGQAIDIPQVADLTKLGIQPSGGQGDIIARNFIMSPTLPFKGGTVSVTAGLIALTGENYLSSFLQTLGNFASLLTVPQLSTAIDVTRPLTEGIQNLFGIGNGRMHLGYLNTYNAPDLASGYLAVVPRPAPAARHQGAFGSQRYPAYPDGCRRYTNPADRLRLHALPDRGVPRA